MLSKVISRFLDLVFPTSCINCEKEGIWLCLRCFDLIPTILADHCAFCEKKTNFGATCGECKSARFLDGAISCIPYSNPITLAMIHAWKYDSNKFMTPYLAKFVLQGLIKAKQRVLAQSEKFLHQGLSRKDIGPISSIPPILTNTSIALQAIPLHPKKEKQRGFNQAYLLARALAQNSDKWHVADFIARTKKTAAQATLSGSDRASNMQNAFSLSNKDEIAGKHIMIVDDVITTASTTDNSAHLLKDAGAASVWALTIAYGHPIKA